MSRQVARLSLWLVCVALPAAAAGPAPGAMPVTITFAEQPVQLARDTAMYSAGRGAALQPDDLLVSGTGALQIDAGGTTVAVGPASAVFIRNNELVLLSGWMKVNGSATRPLLITTAGVQFDSAGVNATLHATPGSTELFAESAGLVALELPTSRAPRRVKVPREQFGVRSNAQPLKLAARPPAAFLAGMPRTFLDALIPVAAKGPAVAPKRARTATLTELAPLLLEQPVLRQQVQARFAPARRAHAATPPAQSPQSPNTLF